MENAAALIAALVAVVTLAITIRQLRASDRIARISARPHLTLQRAQSYSGDSHFSVVMRNGGLGPAEVSAFAIKIGDRTFNQAEPPELFTALTALGLFNAQWSCIWWGPGEILGVGEETEVFALNKIVTEDGIDIHDVLAAIEVIVHYRSFYGDKYSAICKDNNRRTTKYSR